MKAFDRTGIEVIDGDECLRLLRGRRVGRVGIVVGGEPLILPVNYAVQDDTIVFRSAPGSKWTWDREHRRASRSTSSTSR